MPPPTHNHLLQCLPRADADRLLATAERIELTLAEVLWTVGEPTPHVWFPEEGFVSLVAPLDARPALEVGMVGREGMLGVHLALGVAAAPLKALVQGGGSAWRIGQAAFGGELARSASLRQLLGRYVYVLMAQLASTAACQRFHAIEPRLARWLLMTQDRAKAPRFRVTHEFLALLLGVRRVGVTTAAAALQRRGLIEYHRGDVRVLDRSSLEAASCTCYAAERAIYSRILG